MDSLWMWEEIDPDAAHSWLRDQVDSGTWTLQDTLGALTSAATAVGTNGTRTGIGAFQLATAEETFGLDRLARDLASELADVEPFIGDRFHIPPTSENRKRFAIVELRKVIDARADEKTDTSTRG
jgi:acetyl-CoA acetyltransferase